MGTVEGMRANTFKVKTSAGEVMASVFWDRAIFADIQEVKTINQKGSAKQEDESGRHNA